MSDMNDIQWSHDKFQENINAAASGQSTAYVIGVFMDAFRDMSRHIESQQKRIQTLERWIERREDHESEQREYD